MSLKKQIVLIIVFVLPGLFCVLPCTKFAVARADENEADHEAKSTLRLTLDEATRLTLANHEQIKISQSDIEAAKGNTWQAYSTVLPKLKSGYQYTRNLEKPSLFLESGRVPLGFDNVHQFDVQLTQPLTHFGQNYHTIRSAQLAREASQLLHQQTKADVVFAIRQAYFDALLRHSAIAVGRLSLEASEQILRREEARLRAGEITPFDRQRAELEVETRRADLLQSEGDYRIALEKILRMTGLGPQEKIVLVDNLETFATTIPGIPDFQIDTELNPRIQALSKNAASAEHAKKAARAGFFPGLDFFSAYQGSGQSSQRFFPNSKEFSNSVNLGLNVDIPLFDGMLTLGKYKVADAQARRALWQKALESQELRLALGQATTEAKTQFAKKETQRKSLQLSEELYRQAKSRFENDLIAFIDLKDVQKQLESARLDYLASLYQYAVARAKIEQLLGSVPEHD